MISRRTFLKGFGALCVAGLGFAGYGFGVEPHLRMNVTPYRLTPPRWPRDLNLKIAVLADIHACEPWMPVERVRAIADATNRLEPDLIVLLGDFISSMRFVSGVVPVKDWSRALSGLSAPPWRSCHPRQSRLVVGPRSTEAPRRPDRRRECA